MKDRDCETCAHAQPFGGENDNRCDAWECEYINRQEAIEAYKARKDETEWEWCHDCKEYDQEKHCCHRWSKVIRQTVEEVKESYKIVTCEECKWWKDSDGVYRRGIGAESKCPINTEAVYNGLFYCSYGERRVDEYTDKGD